MVMVVPPPRSTVAVAGGLGRLDLSCAPQATATNASPRQQTATGTLTFRINSPFLMDQAVFRRGQDNERSALPSNMPTASIEPDLPDGCKRKADLPGVQ